MSIRFVARLFCCLLLMSSLTGVALARDCSGCTGNCRGTANIRGFCTQSQNGKCKKNVNDVSAVCDSGCSCNSGGIIQGACACS